MKLQYKHTIFACFTGYVAQAAVNNFLPLLFVFFGSEYGIPLSTVTLLITFNFILQLTTDLVAPGIVGRIGVRAGVVAAQGLAAAGFLALAVLPGLIPPFPALLTSVALYAVGGGLLEVLVSPIVEACPGDNKEGTMSLLHSFYCWGQVGVVLLSTGFFALAGIRNWRILAALWSLLPLGGALLFTRVPIAPLVPEGERSMTVRELLGSKLFWVFCLLMVCAGASELTVSQWASAFAERGLGVDKTLGDLAGPMFFAAMMGLSRLLYGKFSKKLQLAKALPLTCLLCIGCYLLIALAPWPAVGLLGCGICGFSVGILWPGTFSMAAATLRRGGTAMFAYLALAGDLGCCLGPTLAGQAAGLFGDSLQTGILLATLFPALMLAGVGLHRRLTAKR